MTFSFLLAIPAILGATVLTLRDLWESLQAGVPIAQTPTELASFDYTYYDNGLVQSITEAGGTRNFTYDATQQVTSGGFATAPESYSYDEEGNRVASHLSAAHVHDTANQLLQDDAFCYAYDANGNLTTRTEKIAGACTGPARIYSWDVRNRLVRVDMPDGTFAVYRYDPFNRRIFREAGGNIAIYVYDWEAIVLEFDEADTVRARYGHGQDIDQPMVMERGGSQYFYQVDHLGSIRLVTDLAGFVVNSYDFGSFGQIEPSTVALVSSPYTFTAREYDEDVGLLYYRARFLDPSSGRFIQRDPYGFAGGDLNLFRYVFNDPVQITDPWGLTPSTEYATKSSGSTSGGVGFASIGTRLGCQFSNFASLVQVAQGVATGNVVAITEVAGIGSCGGARVGVIVKSSIDNSYRVFTGYIRRPGQQLLDRATNGKLRNTIRDLFRPDRAPSVGNGSTMDAHVRESITGILTRGRLHRIKLQESVNRLRNILRREDLSAGDRGLAQTLLRDALETLRAFP